MSSEGLRTRLYWWQRKACCLGGREPGFFSAVCSILITLAVLVIRLSCKFKDLVIVMKLISPDLGGGDFLAPYLRTLYLETLHLNNLTPRVILSQIRCSQRE